MKIRVFDGYLVEPGKHIPRGIYEADDPALYGRAQYLLDNRHAEAVNDPASAQEPVTEWALTHDDFERLIELVRTSDIIQQAEMVTADTVRLALESSLAGLFQELGTREAVPPEPATIDKALTPEEVERLAAEGAIPPDTDSTGEELPETEDAPKSGNRKKRASSDGRLSEEQIKHIDK